MHYGVDETPVILDKIKAFAPQLGVDPSWAAAIAMTESSLGINQLSPTGARGVFQMTSIAMKDLLQAHGVDAEDNGYPSQIFGED